MKTIRTDFDGHATVVVLMELLGPFSAALVENQEDGETLGVLG